ncbi:GNAT family N-acetyltransferase [Oscillospiraceae bacterium OttesenSCG-928-G22]|nr:GNAT family N-acetyltransferase [Oscillospiraceae bacterium OttesenSCG-928-G22]
MEFIVKRFDELSTTELFDILRARSDVFIVEQTCPYRDIDELDLETLHVFSYVDGKISAYARILRDEASARFGRFLVLPSFRGAGLGRMLALFLLAEIGRRFPGVPVDISAQSYLVPFYRSLGFSPVSDPYDDVGIEHVDMRLTGGTL